MGRWGRRYGGRKVHVPQQGVQGLLLTGRKTGVDDIVVYKHNNGVDYVTNDVLWRLSNCDVMDEDNVVGALFLQNGEDNSYDPEDFVQELDVGPSAPHFRISVADDDGGIPGSLFACAVWNGAVRVSMGLSKGLTAGKLTYLSCCHTEIHCHAFRQTPGAGERP
jgi:hypothetical protein